MHEEADKMGNPVDRQHMVMGLTTIARDELKEMTMAKSKMKLMEFLNGHVKAEQDLIKNEIMPEYNKTIAEIQKMNRDYNQLRSAMPNAGPKSPMGIMVRDAAEAKMFEHSKTRLTKHFIETNIKIQYPK